MNRVACQSTQPFHDTEVQGLRDSWGRLRGAFPTLNSRLVLIAVCLAGELSAQISVRAQLTTDRCRLGQAVQLIISCSGAQQASQPRVPEIPGLQFANWQQSSNISIINGRRSASITFKCLIYPKKVGSFSVKGITVAAGGQEYPVQSLAIFVGEPQITASAELSPSEVALNRVSELKVMIVGGSVDMDPPQLPEVDGLRFSKWERQSEEVADGPVLERRDLFTCRVFPARQGMFRIEPITMNVGGNESTVQPQTLRVIEKTAENVLMRVLLSKEQVYLSEPVVLTVELLANKEIEGPNFSLPWLPPQGFLVADPNEGKDPDVALVVAGKAGPERIGLFRSSTSYEGRQYARFYFERLLTPLSPGDHALDNSSMQFRLIKGQKRVRDVFGFSRLQNTYEDVTVMAPPITLNVQPLPQDGRPKNFSGATGNFTLQVTAKPKSVKVGDPITVEMTVSGSGNFETVKLPTLENTKGFRTYDSENKTEVGIVDGKYTGKKVFSLPLVPVDQSIREIPKVSLSFFDTNSAQYRTVEVASIPVEVKPGEQNLGVGLVSSPEPGQRKMSVKPVAAMISPLRRSPISEFRNHASPYYRNPIHLFWLPLPLVLCLAVGMLQKRRMDRSGDSALQRKLKAKAQAEDRLNVAAGLAGAKACQKISEALQCYVADKFGLPPASVDARSAAEILDGNAGAEEILEFTSLLSECDSARFGGAGGEQEKGEMVSRSLELLSRFDRGLK
ncbi:MAG: BatD family protein [Planctomycetota bacterium]|nr:BatD family protein [Planctomycetota bacterium]